MQFPLIHFFRPLRVGCLLAPDSPSVAGGSLWLQVVVVVASCGGCLFPSVWQIKFRSTQRDDTGGLSDSEQAAPVHRHPTVEFGRMGNWLLLPLLHLLLLLLACCPLMRARRYLSSSSFILTGSFSLISTTAKLKVCGIKIGKASAKYPVYTLLGSLKPRQRGK